MKTSKGFTNVGSENGTIRLSTKLYDYSQDATGFAGNDTFDDNFFDQEPSIETRYVLTALRDDLFINDLAIEYNTLFFTGLRKVLSEKIDDLQNYLKSFKGDKPLYFNLYDSGKKVKLTMNSRKQKVKITSEFLKELKGQEWIYKLN